MASSKLKKPPALLEKRTSEDPAVEEEDQRVLTAFKKLKLDAEGRCVKKAEDQSQVILKHKSESTITNDQGDEKSAEDDFESWSQSLKGFCLCDEEAAAKRGQSKWRSMCHYHQSHMRKNSSSCKNKLNFAQAVRTYRPLLQESRLKVEEDKSTPQLLRSAHFSFNLKSTKLSEGKYASLSAPASASSKDSETSPCDKASQEPAATSHTIFAEAVSKHLSDFSSLFTRDDRSAEKDKKAVSSFFNFRDSHGGRDTDRQAIGPENSSDLSNNSTSATTQSSETASAAEPVPARVDLARERTCSQEARVEEFETSVNELITYFDYYFVLPKGMSSMAEMMYA